MKKLPILLGLTGIFIFSSSFDCNFSQEEDGKKEPTYEGTLSYLTFKTDLNQYFVVDPKNPTTEPIQIEENIQQNSLQLIPGGSYENGKLYDIHNRYLIYIKEGKIYKIDLLETSDLSPERISSEDDAYVVCESKAYTDFLLNERSAYLYKVADSLDECNTDYDWYYVNAAMDEDQDPVKVGEKDIIMPLYDRETGTIVGWLIRDDEKLRYCDEEFDECDKVKFVEENLDKDYLPKMKYLGSFTYVEEGKNGGLFNKELFAVKNRLFLFIYNINDTDESVLFEIPSYKFKYDYENIISHQEGNTIYFTDGGRILKVDIKEIEKDKTIKIIVEEGSSKIKDFAITDNRIVYIATIDHPDFGEMDVMYSVKKDGKDKKILIPLTGDRTRKISIVTVTPDRVYYNVKEKIFLKNVERTVAGYIQDDDIKSINEFEYAYWGGGIFPVDIKAFNQPRLGKILKIEQCIHEDECANNGAIFVYDTEELNNEKTLNVIPLDIKDHEILYGFGTNQIGTGFNAYGKGEIFFMNLLEEDSLFRVTNTEDTDERAIRIEKIPFLTN